MAAESVVMAVSLLSESFKDSFRRFDWDLTPSVLSECALHRRFVLARRVEQMRQKS